MAAKGYCCFCVAVMLLTPNSSNRPVSNPGAPDNSLTIIYCLWACMKLQELVSPGVRLPGRKTPLPRLISGVLVEGGGSVEFSCVQLVMYPPILIITTKIRSIFRPGVRCRRDRAGAQTAVGIASPDAFAGEKLTSGGRNVNEIASDSRGKGRSSCACRKRRRCTTSRSAQRSGQSAGTARGASPTASIDLVQEPASERAIGGRLAERYVLKKLIMRLRLSAAAFASMPIMKPANRWGMISRSNEWPAAG